MASENNSKGKNLDDKNDKDGDETKSEYDKTALDETNGSVQTSELTESSNFEPEPQAEELKHEKVYEGTTKRGPTEISDVDESLQPNIKQTILFKPQTDAKPEYLKTKPKTKIVSRPVKEDLFGLRGPTEPLSTEPGIQASSNKPIRGLAGRQGPEPTAQTEETNRQKIYNVRVVYDEIEVNSDEEDKHHQPENETGLEPSNTEPQPIKCILRDYDSPSSKGPTEAYNVEAVLQAGAIKQARLYAVGSMAEEKFGPTEPFSFEAQVHNIRLKGKIKLSDRIEYLARPKKDIIDRLGYEHMDGTVPEKSLPSWKVLPLFTKIPADGGYPYEITMTQLNKDLLQAPSGKHMDLQGNIQKPHHTYYSLFDPQLKSYFEKEDTRNHLEKGGYISETGKVICSLKDINDFRAYNRYILAKEILQRYHDEDLEEKRKREEHNKKYWQRPDEPNIKKKQRTQVQLRTYIKNAVSTIKESSMSTEIERDRRILNALLRRKLYYVQRTADNRERYDKIYSNHLSKKYDTDRKRKQLEKERMKIEKDKLEKLRRRVEVKKMEKMMQNADFWERKAAVQLKWLKEGFRLENKYNNEQKAAIHFHLENKRRPSTANPFDVQDIKNIIYLLSKEEEEVEQELSAKEDQSHSEYKSRDILETNRLSIGGTTDEVPENENKSKSASAKMSATTNVDKEM